MPQTGTATRTDMANRTLNPSRTVPGGQVITLNLILDGVAFEPEDLFDALETLYGSGKVRNEHEVAAGNVFHLRIVA